MATRFPMVPDEDVMQRYRDESRDTADDTYAWLLAGPLGSGKSLAARHLTNLLESMGHLAYGVEFSDYVRYVYETEGPDGDADDNGLGDWAAEMRRDLGVDYFAERLASEVGGAMPVSQHVVVSGVRSPTTPLVFEEHFDNVTTIVLWALPELRLSRVDEGREAFEERNEREMEEWNCREFYLDPAMYDYLIPNNYDDEELLSLAVNRVARHVIDNSRDASVYMKAPWHQEDYSRSPEVHPL